MATKVILPILGESISQAVLTKWLRNVGDSVKRGDEIAEIETDKATMPIESPVSGALLRQYVTEGEALVTGQVLALVGRPGEDLPEENTSTTKLESQPLGDTVRDMQSSGRVETKTPSDVDRGPAHPVSPAARRRAKELGVEVDLVQPETPGARVTSADVERYADQRGSSGDHSEMTLSAERVKLTEIQKTMARRMAASALIPQFSLSLEVDAGRMVSQMAELKSKSPEESTKVTTTALCVYFASRAVTDHPRINSRFDGDYLTVFREVNIGVAVATTKGLVVPVIHHANELSPTQIADRLRRLAESARHGRLSLDDTRDATLTISNLGMYEVEHFTPCLNPPQVAILGVGRIRQVMLPISEKRAESAPMMTLTIVADHRAIDGVEAAKYLATLKTEMETGLPTGVPSSL